MKITQHPNGFLRAQLWKLPTGESERIHIWEEQGWEDGDIHQHSYDFTSTILAGVMQEQLFTYREDPAGEWERCLVACYTDPAGQYRVDFGPERVRVTPVLTETLIHKAGETYERPKADFHLVTVLEAPLITRSTTGPVDTLWHYFLRKTAPGV